MIVSAFGFADVVNNYHVILDPSRVAAQVEHRLLRDRELYLTEIAQRKPGPLPCLHWCRSLQIRQTKVTLAVAAIRRPQQREQRGDLSGFRFHAVRIGAPNAAGAPSP